jgi:hypothetical protein
MTPQTAERRTRRSPWASEALHLQLLRAVQDHGLQTLVLSDALGQVWAASSRSPTVRPPSPGPLTDDGPDLQRCDELLVQRLRVGPAVLYLSAQRAKGAETALRRSAAGVERILGGLL